MASDGPPSSSASAPNRLLSSRFFGKVASLGIKIKRQEKVDETTVVEDAKTLENADTLNAPENPPENSFDTHEPHPPVEQNIDMGVVQEPVSIPEDSGIAIVREPDITEDSRRTEQIDSNKKKKSSDEVQPIPAGLVQKLPNVPLIPLKRRIEAPSQPSNWVYVQTKNGFKRITMQEFLAEQEEAQLRQMSSVGTTKNNRHLTTTPSNSSLAFASSIQGGFSALSLLIQGILTGMVVAHSAFAFAADQNKLLQVYRPFAVPVHAILYFGYTVALVDALDRFATTRGKPLTLGLFLQFTTFAIGAYFVGAVCTLLCANFDERMADSGATSAIDSSKCEESSSQSQPLSLSCTEFTLWKWLSMTRSIFTVFGWAVSSLRATTTTENHTRELLLAPSPKQLKQQQQQQQSASGVADMATTKKKTSHQEGNVEMAVKDKP